MTRAALASCYVAGTDLDYDSKAYPYYGDYFRRRAPTCWVKRLQELGAFDAAAEEERGI